MGRARKILKKQKFRCVDGVHNKSMSIEKNNYDEIYNLKSLFENKRKRKKKIDYENVYNLTALFEPRSFMELTEHTNIPGLSINYTNLDNNDNTFINKVIASLTNIIQSEINKHKSIKISITFMAVFHDQTGNPITTYQKYKTFAISKHTINNMNLNEIFNTNKDDLLEVEKGESGLTFQYL